MDSRLGALAGCYLHSSSDASGVLSSGTVEFFAFVPDQDTVVTALSGQDAINGTVKNFLTAMNLSGKTLKAGSYYACASGERMMSMTLSSGQVVLYKRVER